jgi:hypothetical protein
MIANKLALRSYQISFNLSRETLIYGLEYNESKLENWYLIETSKKPKL